MKISTKKIEFEKGHVVKNCKKCDGKGCPSCFGYCSFIDKMAEAEIPVDYWYRDISKFYGDNRFKQQIEEYIENIEEKYFKGHLLCLQGPHGTGKTMMAGNILKRALLRGFSAYYSTLTDMVAQIMSQEAYKFRGYIRNVDFLVLDEVDQRFFPSAGSRELYGFHFENVLRTRLQNRMPTIMCTNSEDLGAIFGEELEESFASLRSQFGNVVASRGLDARKNKEKL
jgi:DNA replication protein DnaC